MLCLVQPAVISLFSRDWCFSRALGWELQSQSRHRDWFLDAHPCCDFHAMLKLQWLSHVKHKVLPCFQNQYLWGSCCVERTWREAFEVIAVFFLCGGSNHFSRLYISQSCVKLPSKQSTSIYTGLISPVWQSCGQIRSHIRHTFTLLQYWLSELTSGNYNYPLPWWKLNFWRNSVSPNGFYFQLTRTRYWIFSPQNLV